MISHVFGYIQVVNAQPPGGDTHQFHEGIIMDFLECVVGTLEFPTNPEQNIQWAIIKPTLIKLSELVPKLGKLFGQYNHLKKLMVYAQNTNKYVSQNENWREQPIIYARFSPKSNLVYVGKMGGKQPIITRG